MQTTKARTTTYQLTTYKVATRMANEGYPVDYTVRCPDGALLCFANEGGGGPDYLTGWKPTGKGKLQPAGSAGFAAERAFLLWALTTDVVMAHMDSFDNDPRRSDPTNTYDRSKPSIDLAAIWAEQQGSAITFRKQIVKTAKRTVAYATPEMEARGELGYLQVKRGQIVSDQWRRDAADYIRKKYPKGVTVYGGGDQMMDGCPSQIVNGAVVIDVPLECGGCGEIHSNTALERSGGKCPGATR